LHYSVGIKTLPITWITPLLARTSVATIRAGVAVVSVIVGGVPALIVIASPSTVVTAVPNGMFAASTWVGSTWYVRTFVSCAVESPATVDWIAANASFVGAKTVNGQLQVFEEHLFTELTARVLRRAISAVPGGSEPRVLLTTLPKESHEMGLLMVEAVLSLEGAQCISLGTQMPLMEIVDAVAAHLVDVVAL
jgi:hypothetical protein